METDGGHAEAMLTQFSLAGLDLDTLATHLQRDSIQSSAMSWRRLMARLSAMRTPVSCGRDRRWAPADSPTNRR